MIIVKTKNGDVFINDKASQVVQHLRDKKMVVVRSSPDAVNANITDVEAILYTNEAQPTSWKDEGSEIQRLMKRIEELDREKDQIFEHSRFMREWFFIYQEAFDKIKYNQEKADRENNGVYVSPLPFIEEAEKKYEESQKRFQEVSAKWQR